MRSCRKVVFWLPHHAVNATSHQPGKPLAATLFTNYKGISLTSTVICKQQGALCLQNCHGISLGSFCIPCVEDHGVVTLVRLVAVVVLIIGSSLQSFHNNVDYHFRGGIHSPRVIVHSTISATSLPKTGEIIRAVATRAQLHRLV